MSKTVKRVSKTVKRVMTVMMVGLVAMLGAKAEAHGFWFNGKPRVCSVCSDGTLIEVLEDPNHPNSLAVAELTVKAKQGVISCPDQTELQLQGNVTLVDESPLVWDSTNKTAHVEFSISDQPFVDLGFCGLDGNGDPVLPKVLIPKMSATYKLYECTGGSDSRNPCSSKILVSSMKLNNCTVPSDAPDGTFYVCNTPEFLHVF